MRKKIMQEKNSCFSGVRCRLQGIITLREIFSLTLSATTFLPCNNLIMSLKILGKSFAKVTSQRPSTSSFFIVFIFNP